MKKSVIILIAIVVALGIWLMTSYNGMMSKTRR